MVSESVALNIGERILVPLHSIFRLEYQHLGENSVGSFQVYCFEGLLRAVVYAKMACVFGNVLDIKKTSHSPNHTLSKHIIDNNLTYC